MKRLALTCVLIVAAASTAQAREWTVQGKKYEADFVKLEDGKVTLLFKDGRMASTGLENLSPADQEFAKNPANAVNLLAQKEEPKPVQVSLDGDDRFTQAILQDPENPAKYYARGMYYTNKGKLDEAINDFRKVAEMAEQAKNDKAMALAHNGLGKAHVKQGEYAQAHQDFTKAIEADDTLAAAYRQRADNLGDYYKSPEGKQAFETDRAAYRKKRDGINKRYLQKFPWQPPYSTTDESIFNAALRNMQNTDYARAEELEYEYGGRDDDWGWGGGGGGVGGGAVGGVAVVGPQVAVGGAVIGPGLAVYPPVAVKGETIELVANPSELAKGMPVQVGPNAPKVRKGETPPPEALQAIKAVDFYRDINGDGQLQAEGDQYLTTDTDGSDGYSAQVSTVGEGFSAGTHNYFAVPKGDGGNGEVDAAAIGALTLQENLLRAAAKSERNIADQLGTAATGGGLSAEGADLLSREQTEIQRILTDVERKVKETAPEVAKQLEQARKTSGMAVTDLRKAKAAPGVASKAPADSAKTNARSVADQIDAAADALATITGSDKPEGAPGEGGAPANPAAAGPVDPYAPGAPAAPPPGPANPGAPAVAAGTLNPPPGAPPGAPGPGAPGGPGRDGPDVVINNYDRDGDGDVDDDDLVINNFDDDRDGAVDRAVGFFDDNDYDRALVEYDRVIGDRPYDIDALSGRARTHLESGGYDYAVRDYDRLISLAPRNADFYYNRGCAHLAGNRLAEADGDFSMSIQLDELQKLGNLAFNNRGITRARQGKFDDAIDDFDKAILINRDDALAYRNRALAFKKLGKLEEAQADLVRFNELNVVVEK
jgi:tetratricopeptide (TPR) repeat protein